MRPTSSMCSSEETDNHYCIAEFKIGKLVIKLTLLNKEYFDLCNFMSQVYTQGRKDGAFAAAKLVNSCSDAIDCIGYGDD